MELYFFFLKILFIEEQMIFICSKLFDGTFTIFELPVIKPKINEYAKLVGTLDGVM